MNYKASACEGTLTDRAVYRTRKSPHQFYIRGLVSGTHKELKNKAPRKQASLKVGYETELVLRRGNTNTEEIF